VTSPSASRRVVARDAPGYSELLSRLGIEVETEVEAGSAEAAFVLVERDGRLDLRPPGEAARPGIQALFPPDHGPTRGGQNPLVRAFGRRMLSICDLTAGLGADAFRLAEAGHQVIGYERDPAVYALLITGWMRDCASGRVKPEIADRLEFVHAESAERLSRIERPESGVYLDPMYPQARRNKALPKRELQVLRALLGDETDAVRLVEAARKRVARVVVKRPHRAESIVPDVSFEIVTKLVRFDVYLDPARMGEAGT